MLAISRFRIFLIKLIKPSNTTLGESQVTRYSVKLPGPGPGNFTEYLVTCDSPSVVFDGLISLIKKIVVVVLYF